MSIECSHLSECLRELGADFFQTDAVTVAKELLGTILQRQVGGVLRRGRIVEVEAYLGPRDLASHASKGRTRRTAVMFGPPGRAYVYLIYGMYDMFNIVVGRAGGAQAILVRAAEPLDGWSADLTGPGKLARAFAITRADNGMDLTTGDIRLLRDSAYRARVERRRRIGIDYAGHWKRRLLRFVDVANPTAGQLRR